MFIYSQYDGPLRDRGAVNDEAQAAHNAAPWHRAGRDMGVAIPAPYRHACAQPGTEAGFRRAARDPSPPNYAASRAALLMASEAALAASSRDFFERWAYRSQMT